MPLYKQKGSDNWIYREMIKGKMFVKSTKTPIKRLADTVAKKYHEDAIKERILCEGAQITIADAMDMYVATQTGNARKAYQYQAKYLKQHLNGMLHEITTVDVQRYVYHCQSEGKSISTVRLAMVCLRNAINLARKNGYRIPSDLQIPSLRTEPKRVRYLTDDEETALLRELDPNKPGKGIGHQAREFIQDVRDLVTTMLDTGVRIGEANILPCSSIDFDANSIRVYRPKVRNESVLFMTDRLREVMRRRIQHRKGEYVFTDRTGAGPRKYAYTCIGRAIQRTGMNAPDIVATKGARITPHSLRKTLASRLVKEGVSIYMVSKILGHSRVRTTEAAYSNLAPLDASAVAVRVLNEMHRKRIFTNELQI